MRKIVIEEGADGAVVEYVDEDESDRDERLYEWAAKAATCLTITPGQAERLSRA